MTQETEEDEAGQEAQCDCLGCAMHELVWGFIAENKEAGAPQQECADAVMAALSSVIGQLFSTLTPAGFEHDFDILKQRSKRAQAYFAEKIGQAQKLH